MHVLILLFERNPAKDPRTCMPATMLREKKIPAMLVLSIVRKCKGRDYLIALILRFLFYLLFFPSAHIPALSQYPQMVSNESGEWRAFKRTIGLLCCILMPPAVPPMML